MKKQWMRRGISLIGFITLSAGFITQSSGGTLTAEMFVTYPLGVIAFYAPRMFEKFLKAWKEEKTDA